MNFTRESVLNMFNEGLTTPEIERELKKEYDEQLKTIRSVELDMTKAEIKEQEERKKAARGKITKVAEQIYNIIFDLHPDLKKKELEDKKDVIDCISNTISTLVENKFIARDTVVKFDKPSELFDNLRRVFW